MVTDKCSGAPRVRAWLLDEFLSQLDERTEFISGLFELAQSVGAFQLVDSFGNFIVRLPIEHALVVGSQKHPDELSISLSKSSRQEYENIVASMRRYISGRSDARIIEHHFFDDTCTSQVAFGRVRH